MSCVFRTPVFALQSVWVKTGTLQWWRNWKPYKWMDVRVALEQFTGSDGMRDSILFIYYMYHEEKKVCSAWDPELGLAKENLRRENSFLKGGKLSYSIVWSLGNQNSSNVAQGTSKLESFLSCSCVNAVSEIPSQQPSTLLKPSALQ